MDKIKKILIAIDDGPTSEKVTSNGFQLGQQLNAEIALVSAVDTTALMTDGGVTPGELADIIKNDFKKSQQLLVEKVFKDYKVWTFVEKGKPFEAILKVAEEWEADLIVLGTHGRTGLSHLLMGSVAEKVIRHSTKPLFIIPTK
ncbi:MAG: universal stress protein [Chitinophagaceae bacterium]|nr:MAG: universal stress protein [Chitinophagaceae bacterium]